jgi:copper chaperone CopZ
MRNRIRVALVGVGICALVATVAFATAGKIERSSIVAATSSDTKTETDRVEITIEGMHCSGCASGIKSMLKRTPGVVSAEVSFETKTANVEYNPADISREKIVEVITNLGYRARIKG